MFAGPMFIDWENNQHHLMPPFRCTGGITLCREETDRGVHLNWERCAHQLTWSRLRQNDAIFPWENLRGSRRPRPRPAARLALGSVAIFTPA